MAIVVTADIIRGTTGKVTRAGWEFERIFEVRGLTGNAYARIYAGLFASGMPRIGDVHPHLAYTYVEEIVPEVEDSTSAVRYRVVYRTPSARTPATSSTLIEDAYSMTQRTTSFDRDGNYLSVTYNDAAYKQGDATVPDTERSIRYVRVEASSPEPRWKFHDGTVNSSQWKGYPARSLFCTMNARSSNNGLTWEVTYQFIYRPEGYDVVLVYHDSNGDIPSDVSASNGVGTARVIRESDFNQLNL